MEITKNSVDWHVFVVFDDSFYYSSLVGRGHQIGEEVQRELLDVQDFGSVGYWKIFV